MKRIVWLPGLFLLGLALAASTGLAETPPGCREATLLDPPRTVYRCAGGLSIEAEAADALDFEAGPGAVAPEAIFLERGGAFVERGSGAEPFQILTPHAIAAVRGTTFAVDVEEHRTAVFVVEGAVAVSAVGRTEEALLSGGEGVDVAEGEPLTVREWPRDRVTRLLARFAR